MKESRLIGKILLAGSPNQGEHMSITKDGITGKPQLEKHNQLLMATIRREGMREKERERERERERDQERN